MTRLGGGTIVDEADRRAGLALVPVSRETEDRLVVYAALLRRWQAVKNLVGPDTLDRIWTRHFADSAQVLDALPDARRWVDMGSGAGFPGLVLAIQLAGVPGAAVHLVEANARKCAFLREVVRETRASAIVHHGRMEDVASRFAGVDAVTARALAPLPRLVALAAPVLRGGAQGVFLKGKHEGSALPGASDWVINGVVPSRTSPDGHIVLVRWRVAAEPGPEGAVP